MLSSQHCYLDLFTEFPSGNLLCTFLLVNISLLHLFWTLTVVKKILNSCLGGSHSGRVGFPVPGCYFTYFRGTASILQHENRSSLCRLPQTPCMQLPSRWQKPVLHLSDGAKDARFLLFSSFLSVYR